MKKIEESKTPTVCLPPYDTYIEHFYLFGVEPTSIKVESFDESGSYLKPEFLTPKQLSKFPPYDKNNHSDINERIILNHVFPKGFKLTNKKTESSDEYFYFSINNLFEITLSEKKTSNTIYFSCLLIYESLQKYFDVIFLNWENTARIEVLEKYKEEVEPENIFIPKVICFSSFVPCHAENRNLLKRILLYVRSNKITVPIEKIIENIVFGIPRPVRGLFYLQNKKKNPLFPKQKDDINIILPELNEYSYQSYKYQNIFEFLVDDILTIYKCLLLEIPTLFFSSKKEILVNIYGTFVNLLYPLRLQCPHQSILPEINCGIIENAKNFVFGINQRWVDQNNNKNIPTYFQQYNLNVMNKNILICDIDNHKLHYFLYKNKIQNVINFLDLGNCEAIVKNENEVYRSKVINLDCNNKSIECKLPIELTKKLVIKLTECLSQYSSINEFDANINKKIGEEVFYRYLINILLKYKYYIYDDPIKIREIRSEIFTKNINDIKIDFLFKIEEFLPTTKNDIEFYKKFLNTKILKDFFYRKYLNLKQDRLTILFFDESIKMQKNKKKIFSKKPKDRFLNNPVLACKKTYQIKESKDFETEEYNNLEKNKDKLKYYYQNYENGVISYFLFPKLVYDNNLFSYQLKIKYDQEIFRFYEDYQNLINGFQDTSKTQLYKKYINNVDLNKIIDTFPHMNQNYLLLTWLNIFYLTFYYCEEKEKEFRTIEMIEVLSKMNINKNRIIPLLILTAYEYGEEKMMINIYDTVKRFNLSFDYSEYTFLIDKFISEKKMDASLKKISLSNSRLSLKFYRGSDEINLNLLDSLEKRSSSLIFKQRAINEELEKAKKQSQETIIFDDSVKCPKCNKGIEIGLITNGFINLKGNGIKCHFCQNVFNPIITVQYKKNEESFLLKEKFKLYSLSYLFGVSNEIIEKYGIKIDLGELRKEYHDFFWNCVIYFGLNGYSYDLMIKYTTFKIKKDKDKKKNEGDDKGTGKRKKKQFQFLKIDSKTGGEISIKKNN